MPSLKLTEELMLTEEQASDTVVDDDLGTGSLKACSPAETAMVPSTVLLQAAKRTQQPQPSDMVSQAQLTLAPLHDRLPCTAGACLTAACCPSMACKGDTASVMCRGHRMDID